MTTLAVVFGMVLWGSHVAAQSSNPAYRAADRDPFGSHGPYRLIDRRRASPERVSRPDPIEGIVRGWPRRSGARAVRAQSPSRVAPRDTLTNGAAIGAIAGGVALGSVAAAICRAFQEPGDPSCVADALRLAAVGGAVGGGIGIAVDAALTRHAGVAVGLRVNF